jgi:DNA recombination protein RmuC
MFIEIIIISFIILAGFIVLIIFFNNKIKEISRKLNPSAELLEWLKNTNLRLDDQNRQIVNTLQSSSKSLNERLDNAARYISDVQKNIGEMSEIGRGMKELQEFLRSPKVRGQLGEQILKEILSQLLPKHSFHLQYSFKSGVTVDAIIKTDAGIIPIDSKFPMENFRRLTRAEDVKEKKEINRNFVNDIKKHIDDISQKYILTEEGTIDYALMYIPSEAIYYEMINNTDLFDYAELKRILPVSPLTFWAYLRAILMSFEGQQIEKKSRQILQTIRAVKNDYAKVEDNLKILNRHLTNAFNQLSDVFSSLHLLGQKITSADNIRESDDQDSKKIDLR